MRPNMSKMRFFFCPCFLEDFIKLFFGRCRSGTCRKHYKNRGFGAWVVKAEKMRFCPKTFVCFDKARDFVTHSRFFFFARWYVLLLAVPQTPIFIVVSGPHTAVGIGGVPGTTTKIVVSGTSAETEKPAEPKKGSNREWRYVLGCCAWNHCFYSGFRRAHWGGFCSCAWNHCKNSGFGHMRWRRQRIRRQRRSKSR